MRKFLLLLTALCVMLATGCSKKGFIRTAARPEVIIGTSIAAVIGGIKYFGGRFGIRKKKELVVEMADAREFKDFKYMPYCDESHRILQ